MNRESNSSPPTTETLLEQGRLALRVIQCRERAARFKAKAAQLHAALLLAEKGELVPLEKWLQRHPLEMRSTEADIPFDSSSHQLRFDTSHHVPDSTRAFSWERMEKAAERRLQERDATMPASDFEPVAIHHEPEPLQLDFVSWTETATPKRKAWWLAPHIWTSLILHMILVLGLSVFVVSTLKVPQVFSIVSAAVESDQPLMETPLEMDSRLEMSESEPIAMEPVPTHSDLKLETEILGIPKESGPSPAVERPIGASLGAASELVSTASGSKMVTGAEFFGLKAAGNTFVFVVDNSGSMRQDGAFDAAKKELMRSLSSMKPKQRFHISFFGEEVESLKSQDGDVEKYPVYATPENLSRAYDWLNRVLIQKGWPPNDALTKAIQMQPDGIFLLFDGDTKVDVAKFLRKANRSDDILSADVARVPIHVIHFCNESFQRQMRQIAEENAGTYRFVPRPDRSKRTIR
jgi:hypothetical protein